MQFTICAQHGEVAESWEDYCKSIYFCMNKYCSQSFRPICATCKIAHRDHSVKVLTMARLSTLLHELLGTPFSQISKYISDAAATLRKINLLQEFQLKIEELRKSIKADAQDLVSNTETLLEEYARSRQKMEGLAEVLSGLEEPGAFDKFEEACGDWLSNVCYQFRKCKLEYSNERIQALLENRKDIFESTRLKIEQMKDYSMKTIEVSIHSTDSDGEDQDLAVTRKEYLELKAAMLQRADSNVAVQTQQRMQAEWEKQLRVLEEECQYLVAGLDQSTKRIAQLQREKKEMEQRYRSKIVNIESALRRGLLEREASEKIKQDCFGKLVTMCQNKGDRRLAESSQPAK